MQSMSRRALLKSTALGCSAILTAPMLNLGRYRLFASATTEYSERAVRLIHDSLVIDMLSPLSLNFPLFAKWRKPRKMARRSKRWVTTGPPNCRRLKKSL